jgi:hypothetical protein
MKTTVFGDVARCVVVGVYQRFGSTFCHTRLTQHPDDGGSRKPRNVGKFLSDYTAQHPRS